MPSNLITTLIKQVIQLLHNQSLERAYRNASQEIEGELDEAIADGLSDEMW